MLIPLRKKCLQQEWEQNKRSTSWSSLFSFLNTSSSLQYCIACVFVKLYGVFLYIRESEIVRARCPTSTGGEYTSYLEVYTQLYSKEISLSQRRDMDDLNSILFQVTLMVRTKMVAKMMTLMVNNIPALLLKEAKKKSKRAQIDSKMCSGLLGATRIKIQPIMELLRHFAHFVTR